MNLKLLQEWITKTNKSPKGCVSKKDVNRFLVFLALSRFCKVLKPKYMILEDTEDLLLESILKNKHNSVKIDFTNYYKFEKIDDNLIKIKLPKIVNHMLFTKYGKKAIMSKTVMFLKEHLIQLLIDTNQWETLDDIELYFFTKSYSNVSIKNAKQLFGKYIKYREIKDIINQTIVANNKPTTIGRILEFLDSENIIDIVFQQVWEEIQNQYSINSL